MATNSICLSLWILLSLANSALRCLCSIAPAPAPVFIRYRNEDHLYPEEWVNIELTTHQIVPESWRREDDYVRQITARSKALFERLKLLGWQEMDEPLQKKLEAGNEQGRLQQEKTATPQTISNL